MMAVDRCARRCALRRVGEQPVLPSDHERLDAPLAAVVVDLQAPVEQERRELLPLVVAVSYRFTGGALRRHSHRFLGQPLLELGERRGAPHEPLRFALLRRGVMKVPLDGEQLVAEGKSHGRSRLLLRLRRQSFKHLREAAPSVRPAADEGDALQSLICRITVDVQVAPIVFEKQLRMLRRSRLPVFEQDDRRAVSARSVKPEVRLRLRCSTFFVKNLQGRLIGMQNVPLQKLHLHPLVEDSEVIRPPDHPVRQRLAGEMDSVSFQDLLLPVERQPFHELAFMM